jgi:hypothetical protein
MTSGLDIYRTANVLIREHGKDAALEAAHRADAMLEKGSLDGQRVWKRVLAAVKEIQRRAASLFFLASSLSAPLRSASSWLAGVSR